MKIAVSNYNPANQINQVFNTKQQKSPAFQGDLYVVGNPKNVRELPKIINGVVQEIEKRTFQGINEITVRIKNDNKNKK